MTREIESLPVEGIDVAEGRRIVRPEAVDALAASMSVVGLMQPITCRAVGDDVFLVAGHHRLEAARKLGWEFIDCIVLDHATDVQAAIAEIDENLMRAELTPAERAEQTARRKELYLIEHPETGHGGDRRSSRQVGDLNDRFTADTAKSTMQSERSVQRDATRGEKIAPEVMAEIKADPDLNKGVVLDMVARAPREAQQQRLSEIAADRARPRETVEIQTPEEAEDEAVNAVLRKISKWPEPWRARLRDALNDLEVPVMDRGRA